MRDVFIVFNTEFIVFNTEFIVFNAEFIVFNTEFIVFNTEFIVFNTKLCVLSTQSQLFEPSLKKLPRFGLVSQGEFPPRWPYATTGHEATRVFVLPSSSGR